MTKLRANIVTEAKPGSLLPKCMNSGSPIVTNMAKQLCKPRPFHTHGTAPVPNVWYGPCSIRDGTVGVPYLGFRTLPFGLPKSSFGPPTAGRRRSFGLCLSATQFNHGGSSSLRPGTRKASDSVPCRRLGRIVAGSLEPGDTKRWPRNGIEIGRRA